MPPDPPPQPAPPPHQGRGLATAIGAALAGDWPGKGLVLAALVAGATVFGVRWVDAGAAPDEAAMAAVAKQLDAVEAKLDKVVEHLAEASLTRREADRIERILDRATRRPEAGR